MILFCLAAFTVTKSQTLNTQPYRPTHEEIMERYKAAALRDSTVKNTIYRAGVTAHWIDGSPAFWYCNILKDSVTEYLYINAAKAIKKPLFDKLAIANALSIATGNKVDADKLLLKNLSVNADVSQLYFSFSNKKYNYNNSNQSVTVIDSLPVVKANHQFNEPPGRWESFETDSISANKKYIAFIQNNNIFIKAIATGNIVQYTTDGSDAHPYGSIAWSPDSRYIVAYHITPVIDSPVYHVLSSLPNTTRGKLVTEPYKQPGDPFTTYEMFICPVDKNTAQKVNTPVIDFFDAPLLHWSKDNRYFCYEKVDRGHQRFRIIEVDAQTGNTRNVIDEQTNTFIYANRIYTKYLPESKEIIWSSEKDGWYHLYLVDAATGNVKNTITRGDYVVRDIDSIDEKKREVWFAASGMNAGEDPYYVHYYRISFDGSHLVELTPEHANHTLDFSPDKKYYLDTYSEVNRAPVISLHTTANGKQLMEVERADISDYLAVVKRLPQPFVAKGRDGKTDIYGIVCLPTEMDSTKRYPIIEDIYAGPQDAFVPKSFMGYYREMQSIADLGFIVVQMDGMGTANRSKAFHDVCWKNLADAGFADRILWMKALAKQYAYVDTTRVGLFGTSAGGQNALGGLLFHPEFYKAAVAACGCHDNRIDKQWWNEQWMGYPVGRHYEEQSNVTNACKLQGSLLLIVGEDDHNVPPESTYRVIDALIKAKKMFDFFPVPGMDHSDGGPYGRMRKRDFFVQHLLGVDPPNRNNTEL
jgi:dipeptidyl aminopeptidase/acylaminoacyl peptidase